MSSVLDELVQTGHDVGFLCLSFVVTPSDQSAISTSVKVNCGSEAVSEPRA